MILRILHFSPSTATGRHDSYRASLVFLCHARAALYEVLPSSRAELVWALPAISSKSDVHQLLSGADLTIIATPTYAQGSPWFVRRFLELGAGIQLWGRLGSAFATAGGQHTGGDVAVADTLRSLMGMGMATFTFAQKFVVFGAQQKFLDDGTFELIDIWFLQQLARTAVAHLAGRRRSGGTEECAARWRLNTAYYEDFPKFDTMKEELGEWVERINQPLTNGLAYRWWTERLGEDCTPPDGRGLPFYHLLPSSAAHGL